MQANQFSLDAAPSEVRLGRIYINALARSLRRRGQPYARSCDHAPQGDCRKSGSGSQFQPKFLRRDGAIRRQLGGSFASY
jgi:hypothetical protein